MTRASLRRSRLVAWRGSSLLILDERGECGEDPLAGFYYREARYLRTLRLRLNGAAPWLCHTLRFWRDKHGSSHVELLRKRGTFHLAKQPPPESLSATPGDRFGALVHRVLHF